MRSATRTRTTMMLLAMFTRAWCPLFVGIFAMPLAASAAQATLDASQYDPSCGIAITQRDSVVSVVWPIHDTATATILFSLDAKDAIVKSVSISQSGDSVQTVATDLDPVLSVRVGDRDLEKRSGWTIFFDRMQTKPNEVYLATLGREQAVATSNAQRATLTLGPVSAGPFHGVIRWTFYHGSPIVLQEAVLETARERTAFLYDTGLVCRGSLPKEYAWIDAITSQVHAEPVSAVAAARNIAVRGRTVCAAFEQGCIAVFPPPHRYFYPLDFSNNLSNVWIGPHYASQALPTGLGIRHDPAGDNRFVPWFNAPVGSAQEMGVFWCLSNRRIDETLETVAQLTRHDRFERLPGHTVFSSHYHVEHTRELLAAQQQPTEDEASITATTPGGREYIIPPRLQTPGFTRMLRDMGIDIVHLAEFHFGATPQLDTEQRVESLELLHAEARRLSDAEFLLLPGEEPNVHLGGHWISLFPKPVYWVLNRPAGMPFVTQHSTLGNIYHVGNAADMLRLLQLENGLAWTAHPRIKGSTGFPDAYRDELFYQSDRFLGAAWKAMPADLSLPRLGMRVLNLLNDMSNWGFPKYVLGEVDVFKIEPEHELYGHMNVNYLRTEEIPAFDHGWQAVLDVLRAGQFFVTTGEVLIPDFRVNGCQSGQLCSVPSNGNSLISLDLRWTFPLAYAEVVYGDGINVFRQRFDLSATSAFGEQAIEFQVELAGQRWVRMEIWDVATNGAFTQPVWLQTEDSP